MFAKIFVMKATKPPVYFFQRKEKSGKWSRRRYYKKHSSFKKAISTAVRSGLSWTGWSQ